MSDFPFDPELWHAVLGAPPPPYDFDDDGPYVRRDWPREDEGPLDGVFWLRWIAASVIGDGGTVEAATALRVKLRQDLATGALSAVAVHPETGRLYPVPQSIWQATGSVGRSLWWSGLYLLGPEGGIPCDVYIVEPGPSVSPEQPPNTDMGTRERNTVARLVYGLTRVAYAGHADAHGTVTEIARDLEKRGLNISADTIGKWIRIGRDQYDPAADKTLKT